MQVTHQGLVEIEQSEGFSSRPYLDTIAKPARWTIGFGETNGITAKSKAITRKEAEQQLIRRFEKDYAWALEPFEKLQGFNQNMYDALASFIWNCGTGAVGSDTKVGKALRARAWKLAGLHMMAWCKAGGRVIAGLQLRRQREVKMLMSPVSLSATRSMLTSEERDWVEILEAKRKIRKRHRGWDNVSPDHLATAAKYKRQISDRTKLLGNLIKNGEGDKANRKARLMILTDVLLAV